MGHSSWPKQLVPQEMAGNSQIQGLRYGISHSLRPLQAWGLLKGLSQSKRWGAEQPLYRHRDSVQCQRHSGSAKAGPSFSMFCPSRLQGKGPFTQGLGRTRVWLCQSYRREPFQFPAFHVSPHSMLIRGPGVEGGCAPLHVYLPCFPENKT